MTDRLLDALVTAIQPPSPTLAGHEEEFPVHRDIALRRGTHVGDHRDRIRRVGDVPHLNAVVVALDGVVAGEGQVRVGLAHEGLLRRRRRQHAHVPDGLARVEHSGLEADAWVGGGGIDVQAGRVLEGDGRNGRHGGRRAGSGCGLRGAAVHDNRQGRKGEERREARGGPGVAGPFGKRGHGAFLTFDGVTLGCGIRGWFNLLRRAPRASAPCARSRSSDRPGCRRRA